MELVTGYTQPSSAQAPDVICSNAEAHAAFKGSCVECRLARFNPGPPSNLRRVNFFGAFRQAPAAKRLRVNRAHVEALTEDVDRYLAGVEGGLVDREVA